MNDTDYQRMVEQAASLIEAIPQAAIDDARKHLAARLASMDSAEIGACMEPTQPDFVASDDFLAGVRFSAQMIADKDFDY